MAALSTPPVRIVLRAEVDIVRARRAAARLARELDLPPLARARLDLVVAELASNVIRHAGHGSIGLKRSDLQRASVDVYCQDSGPGLERRKPVPGDPRRGLGLGLSVVRELADALDIDSAAESGTHVHAVIWA